MEGNWKKRCLNNLVYAGKLIKPQDKRFASLPLGHRHGQAGCPAWAPLACVGSPGK